MLFAVPVVPFVSSSHRGCRRDAGRLAPAGLDRRGETDQVVRRVLGWGERLAVARMT